MEAYEGDLCFSRYLVSLCDAKVFHLRRGEKPANTFLIKFIGVVGCGVGGGGIKQETD